MPERQTTKYVEITPSIDAYLQSMKNALLKKKESQQ